jgi:hypothetical protein
MSSKRRVGVLEAHEGPESSTPQTFCGRGIAEYLLNQSYAQPIGKRLIRMVKLTAAQAIELAKQAREQAIKLWERAQLRLGVGNILPYSRPTDPGQHFHYEIPHAGDVGQRRHFRKRIQVSARPQSHLAAQFLKRTQPIAPVLADAFPA